MRFVYNGANQTQCIDADASGACNGTDTTHYLHSLELEAQSDGVSAVASARMNALTASLQPEGQRFVVDWDHGN